MDRKPLENCIVLFPAVGAVSRLTDRRVSPSTQSLISSLTPEVLAALSAKHGIPLAHGTSRRPALTAGSDDHGHRRAGTIFTEVSGKLDVAAYLERVMNGEARSVGDAGDLNAMAMCIKQGAYEHFRRKERRRTRSAQSFSSMSWTCWLAVFRRRTRIRPEARARWSRVSFAPRNGRACRPGSTSISP